VSKIFVWSKLNFFYDVFHDFDLDFDHDFYPDLDHDSDDDVLRDFFAHDDADPRPDVVGDDHHQYYGAFGFDDDLDPVHHPDPDLAPFLEQGAEEHCMDGRPKGLAEAGGNVVQHMEDSMDTGIEGIGEAILEVELDRSQSERPNLKLELAAVELRKFGENMAEAVEVAVVLEEEDLEDDPLEAAVEALLIDLHSFCLVITAATLNIFKEILFVVCCVVICFIYVFHCGTVRKKTRIGSFRSLKSYSSYKS
jgi:hypothetical protein